MNREIWIYDIEVYPNLFCVTFWDNQANEKKIFEVSYRKNEAFELYSFLITNTHKYLVGYNSINYDDKVLKKFINIYERNSWSSFTEELFEYSKSIINGTCTDSNYTKQPWNSIDLLLIHRFHKLGIGLKQVGVTLKCPKIQDLPYAYDKELTNDEIEKVIKYNANDVFITYKLYKASLEEINLRKDISQAYGVSVLNSSRPNIADKIVTKFIRDKTGWDYNYLKDLRDTETKIDLKDIISPYIEFKTPQLQKLLAELKSTVVDAENSTFEHSFVFDEGKYNLALGGLHSDNKSQIYLSDDNYELIDFDFGSYYPLLMINLEIEPPQLKNVLLPIIEEITEKRLAAKDSGDKITANTLKITINSIYGKLGFIYGYLYSPKSMYSVTVNGQLYLLQLIERLSLAGIKCFYANTDGITCRVRKDQVELYYEICNKFAREVKISCEYQKYSKCIIRDCNNYLIVTSEGKLKKKGSFVTDTFDKDWEKSNPNATEILSKGFDMPVIAKAVEAYFVKGTPVREFITNHTDLYDFCKSQKVGSQYEVFSTSSLNGEVVYKKEQRTNRYIISNRGQKLYKKRKEDSDTNIVWNASYDKNHGYKEISNFNDLVSGFYVTLFNDYSQNIDINYNYYISEANKLIFPFEDPQLSLF
jgi:hypothetical protein